MFSFFKLTNNTLYQQKYGLTKKWYDKIFLNITLMTSHVTTDDTGLKFHFT